MSILATVIGDCELFSVITEQVSWTFSKWFHNIGLGNVEFLIFLLFLIILYRETDDKTLKNVYLVLKSAKCFILKIDEAFCSLSTNIYRKRSLICSNI